MRHLVKGRKLGRTKAHRAATMKALSTALIKEHRIITTLPKAKELRRYVEPLITRAKEDTSHNRRQVLSNLDDKRAVSLLFDEVAPKVKDRPGGYTRVLKLGTRAGDGAEMSVIELVDYNDIKPEDSQKKKRTRRAGKSNTSESADTKEKKPKKKAKGKQDKQPKAKEEKLDEADEEKAEVSESVAVDSDSDDTEETKED